MRIRVPFASMLLVAALAACGGREAVDDEANGAGLPEPTTATPTDPAGSPRTIDETTDAAPTEGSGTAAIPAALHGRWGLAPGDCTSTRGDAKGLLTISAEELRFYESRAVPAAGIEAHADRISGDFNFTGEGQRWTKFQALKVSGNKLTRTENNPAASFAYAKC